MIKYSKKEIELTTEAGNTYTSLKMSPFNIMSECMKLSTIIGTSIGAAADAYTNRDQFEEGLGLTLTSLTNMLHENLDEEHFIDLQSKLFGGLMFDGKKITDEHFAEDDFEGDFLEVWWWLFRENIVNFILSSGMIRSKILPLWEKVSPKMKEEIGKLLKEVGLEINEK